MHDAQTLLGACTCVPVCKKMCKDTECAQSPCFASHRSCIFFPSEAVTARAGHPWTYVCTQMCRNSARYLSRGYMSCCRDCSDR